LSAAVDDRRFLVTGAYGCVGAWVVHELVVGRRAVATFDLSGDPRRLALLLDEDAVRALPHVQGDIADLRVLERAIDEHGITNVIHLAALQVPFCRADPPLGARVNVLGTVNVFEAAKSRELAPIVFASSVAAFDAVDGGLAVTMSGHPGTIYGVYKRANEATASVYRREAGVSSIGLRPHTVYGVGRDQGVTSAPTAAMLAAAARVPYTIPYGGGAQLQLVRDVARAFVEASLLDYDGASVHNLPTPRVSIADVVRTIVEIAPESEGSIGFGDTGLPFPEELDGSSFEALVPGFAETPLDVGIGETIARFRELLAEGRLERPAV